MLLWLNTGAINQIKLYILVNMSPENFCYWLQGYFEIAESGEQLESLDEDQIQVIQEHLALVLNKVTGPKDVGSDNIEPTQEEIKQMLYC